MLLATVADGQTAASWGEGKKNCNPSGTAALRPRDCPRDKPGLALDKLGFHCVNIRRKPGFVPGTIPGTGPVQPAPEVYVNVPE